MDPEISRTTRFVLNKDSIAWQSLDTEAVLVHLAREEMHVANPTAAVLIESLHAGATLPELVDRVTRDYEVEAPQATADVEAFLKAMLEAGLIAASPEPAPKAPEPSSK